MSTYKKVLYSTLKVLFDINRGKVLKPSSSFAILTVHGCVFRKTITIVIDHTEIYKRFERAINRSGHALQINSKFVSNVSPYKLYFYALRIHKN
jgi:hypothetical protein